MYEFCTCERCPSDRAQSNVFFHTPQGLVLMTNDRKAHKAASQNESTNTSVPI